VGVNGEPGPFFFPQGRRVFQYQVIDDLSHTVGKHTFRIGFNLLHDTMTDLDFQGGNYSVLGALAPAFLLTNSWACWPSMLPNMLRDTTPSRFQAT